MAKVSLTNKSKSKVSLSNVNKDDTMTWDISDPLTWDDDAGDWDSPTRPLTLESKTKISLNNESK